MLETYYHYHMDRPAHIAQMMQDQRQRIVSSDSSKLARWAMALLMKISLSRPVCRGSQQTDSSVYRAPHTASGFLFPPISSQAQYQQSVALDIWQRIYHELNLEQPDYLKYPPLTPSINTNRQQLVEQFFRTLPKPQELFVSWCREPVICALQGLLNQTSSNRHGLYPCIIFVGEPQSLSLSRLRYQYKRGSRKSPSSSLTDASSINHCARRAF